MLLRDVHKSLLALALVSFAVMAPVLVNGIPNGYDLPHHYQTALTFVESIPNADLYPSWSLNRNYGFGGMETRLYPPVSHYALALAYLATNDWHIASWITLLAFTFVGALGVFLWAREYLPNAQAAFAGCVFALLPYHLIQIYNTFLYAEYAGTSLLPFTFLFLIRTARQGRLADIVGLGLSFGALILTHLPLTVIASACFVIYGLSLLRRSEWVAQLSRISAGAALGLASTSFFWVKVLQEKDMMAKNLIYTDNWIDYRLHFLVTPLQFFEGDLPIYVYENATSIYDLMLLCIVVLATAFTIPFWRYISSDLKRLKSVIAVFLFSIFFVTPFSIFVWSNVKLLQEVQFPWRWLSVSTVAAPIIAASGLSVLMGWFKTDRRPFALIIVGSLLFIGTYSIAQVIRPAPYVQKDEIETFMINNAAKEGFPFWWPKWARREAFDIKEKVDAGHRGVEVSHWDATKRIFTIEHDEQAVDARVAVFYHPNWKATVNQMPATVTPDPNGAVLVQVPSGLAKIELEFIETPAVQAAKYVSAATLAVLTVLLLFTLTSLFQPKRLLK